MTLRIVFRDPKAGPAFKQRMRENVTRIARASSAASVRVAKEIQEQGQSAIRGSGRFGERWTKGLHTTVEPRSLTINKTITVYHDEPAARVHEFGGRIVGKPLLWVPLSYTGERRRAADYPGGLARVNRRGKPPLLISIREHRPIYIGLRSVTVRPRWGLRRVTQKVMANFVTYYNANLR